MNRDYQKLTRAAGIWVPRWLVYAVVVILFLLVGLRILIPPAWTVQRLDSPDGERSAKLLRTKYLSESFVVHVRDGMLWRTAYYSPPITNDYRVDLGERLSWSEDSGRIYLQIEGTRVWGYDFDGDRDLRPDEL